MMKIFVLYDVTAEQWLTPFFSRTNGTCFREIQATMKQDPSSVVAMNAKSFELYEVGSWDDSTGSLVVMDRRKICTLDQVSPE